jgi:hypothetical protein
MDTAKTKKYGNDPFFLLNTPNLLVYTSPSAVTYHRKKSGSINIGDRGKESADGFGNQTVEATSIIGGEPLIKSFFT